MFNPQPSPAADQAMRTQDWWLITLSSAFKFTLLGFYLVAVAAMLKAAGYTLQQLSWVYLLSAAEAAKILFAVLLERYQSSRLGRFRFWLLCSAAGMAAVLSVMMTVQPQRDIGLLMMLCCLLSCLSVIFGCAVIGLGSVLMPFRLRGYGGAVQVVAARLGRMAGGAGVLWLYGHYGWHAAVGSVAAFAMLMTLVLVCYREPHGTRSGTEQAGLTAISLMRRILTFWQTAAQGGQWFVLLLVSCMPYAAAAATFVPKLADLGWLPQQTGTVLSVAVPLTCMPAACWGGLLARRFARRRLTVSLLALQVPLLASLLLLDNLAARHPWLPVLPLALLSFGYTLLLPVVSALIMDKARPEYAALDNALQLSVMVGGAYAAGFAALRLAAAGGYGLVYGLAAAAGLAVCIGAFWVLPADAEP